jgi:O-antigen/teichoic acid export membrane protein
MASIDVANAGPRPGASRDFGSRNRGLPQLFRSTLLYLPAQIIGPLFQLISVIVWTHVISESAVGVITLVVATHELLQTVFLYWWSQYALRFFGALKPGEQSEHYYRTENAILLLSVAIQSAVAVVILQAGIIPGADSALVLAVVAYVVTRSFNLYIAERARAAHQIGVYSIQQTIGPAAGFLIGLLLIETLGDKPEWPILGYAAAQLVAVVGALPLIRSGWRIGPIDRRICRDALHYGIPLMIGGALTWLSLNAPRFVLTKMLGVGSVGLFAVGYGLGWRATAVASLMVTASAFPLAVRAMESGDVRQAMRQLSDNSALLAAILLPSVIGLFLMRGEIVHILIAPAFQSATLTILPLAALTGAVRNYRAHFFDQAFLLHRRTRALVAINVVEATLTVILSIVFVRLWGLAGTVIATTTAAIVAAALSLSFSAAFFGLRLPVGHLLRICTATAVMALSLKALPVNSTAVGLALAVVFGGVVYLVALALLYGPRLRLYFAGRVKPAAAQLDRQAS